MILTALFWLVPMPNLMQVKKEKVYRLKRKQKLF